MSGGGPAIRRPAGPASRRGSVLLAVLGVSVLVTIIGVSALLLRRSTFRGATLTADAVQARYAAEAVMDQTLLRIAADPAWRSTFTSGTWVSAVLQDGIQTRFKLFDELDGNLNNDDAHPVRLYGQATVRDAVRLYSLLLRPLSPANLVTNGDIEAGTTDWSGYDCVLEAWTDGPHGGKQYLSVRNRLGAWAGPLHSMNGVLQSGQAYWVQVWAQASGGTATIRVVLTTIATISGLRMAASSGTLVGAEWTKVAALLTPTWSGTLLSANLYVYTDSGSVSFRLDDALIYVPDNQAVLRPVPDSWRQEVVP